MAEVFRAKLVGPDGFEKLLAIKRVLPVLSEEEEFLRMFIEEARLAAQLQHSNIVQIFDFDEVGGAHYIAMELVDGCDLRYLERLLKGKKRELAIPVALYIAVEMLDALE